MMMNIKHLYIHVPFCKSICAYCDFCHVVYKSDLADKYLDRLQNELKELDNKNFETIYIGGGTPTSLTSNQFERLLEMVKPYSNNVLEYTVEVNPESLNLEKILLLKKFHINRISMGLESSNNDELKLMNRHHTFLDVKEKVNLLKENDINNISLDIIYSLPNQTIKSLSKTIDDALSLNVPHLSLYSLTIEKNSVFGVKGYKSLDSEIEADMYEYIVSRLNNVGYIQYEIANFSKEGYNSKHNMGYWEYNDFIGLGPGSSSKYNNTRIDKTKNINSYINNKDIIDNKEELSIKDLMFENLMMSLRTIYGLDLKQFKQRYNKDALEVFKEAINKNKNQLIIKNDHLIVTKREILNTILVDFIE